MADLWRRLRIRYPACLASVLMPNHLHLVIETRSPREARRILAIELRAFTRRWFPGKQLWATVDEPELIPDRRHLRRVIRYVHLNPCRAGLVSDPLQWEWSTHRDAVGAAFPPWLDLGALRRVWGCGAGAFASDFHRYVSGDPTVRVEGTALPLARGGALVLSPELAVTAVCRAGRIDRIGRSQRPGLNHRKAVVHLLALAGGVVANRAAAALNISSSSVRRLTGAVLTPDECALLAAAVLVASDSRLLESQRGPMSVNAYSGGLTRSQRV
jgi:hypothetical protein